MEWPRHKVGWGSGVQLLYLILMPLGQIKEASLVFGKGFPLLAVGDTLGELSGFAPAPPPYSVTPFFTLEQITAFQTLHVYSLMLSLQRGVFMAEGQS